MSDSTPPQDPSPPPDGLARAVRATFDRHGHGFQFAVLKALRAIHSHWRPDAVEFPVHLNGTHLHVDIVLRSPGAVMAVECKRVDPALSVWCFGRSPLVSSSASGPHLVSLEQIFIPDGALAHHKPMVRRDDDNAIPTREQYHVALEIKEEGKKGDGTGGGRSAIDDALAQAVRGANGVAAAYAAHESPMQIMGASSLYVVPAIVTTARLCVLATPLDEADIATGKLPADARVEERPWLWFRMMTSPGLRHDLPRLWGVSERPPHSLGALADRDYVRSVGIVSVHGLEEFLRVARLHAHELL